MELEMKTKLAEVMPERIEFNYAPLKAKLADKLAYYKALVVTEDSAKVAKSDLAKLRKLKESLNAKKISVKKEFMVPYTTFENEVKEIFGMIDEPITAIGSQLKAFEEQQKAEKQTKIEAFYTEVIGELAPLLPLTKIFNSKWLNTATSAKSIKTELAETISKVKSDIEIIKEMHIECEQTMLDTYLCTLDMSAALAEKTRYEAQQTALKDYAAKQAEKAAEISTVEPTSDEEKASIHDFTESQIIEPEPAPDFWTTFPKEKPQENTKDVKLIFYATTAAFRAELKALTVKHGIAYGGLDE